MKANKLLTENKIYSVLSETLKNHLKSNTPLYKSFKLNDKKSLDLIKEVRKLYSRNLLQLNEIDTSLVTSDLGYEGNYETENVPLDNPIDTITLDIPLFIRMLEYAREDAKDDMDLHDVTEKAISIGKDGEVLTMDNYEDIVGKELTESYNMYHRNPNTKQVIKYKFNIYEQKIDMTRLRNIINEILTK